MIAVWLSLLLFWVYVIFTTKDASDIVWAGLFFLWILLVFHYFITYRRWRREDKLRRQERLESRDAGTEE